MSTQPQIRYIDLFAGCGGISLGLYNAGLKGLFAIERNQDAFSTLKHNLISTIQHFDWPDWLEVKNWEIKGFLKKNAAAIATLNGHVDLVVGGPPCQGFSLAGQRHATDDRNKLIHPYLDFVEIVRPRAIMFENVKGFTLKFAGSRNHSKVAFSEIVIQRLHKMGYSDARGEMLDFSEYGIPQRRQRFIVIATLEGLADSIFSRLENQISSFLASQSLDRLSNTSSAISDLERKHGLTECPDSNHFMSGISGIPKSPFQKHLQLANKHHYTPDSHRFVNHTTAVEAVFSRLLQIAPRNKRIDGVDRLRYGVKKRNVTVLDSAQPALTITTIPDDFVHYSEPRVMTVRECARLQSFPDWFEFKGPYTTGGKLRVKQTPRYTQVGNAVPPLFAEQIGLAIKYALSNG